MTEFDNKIILICQLSLNCGETQNTGNCFNNAAWITIVSDWYSFPAIVVGVKKSVTASMKININLLIKRFADVLLCLLSVNLLFELPGENDNVDVVLINPPYEPLYIQTQWRWGLHTTSCILRHMPSVPAIQNHGHINIRQALLNVCCGDSYIPPYHTVPSLWWILRGNVTIGGSRRRARRTAPLRVQILSFWHTKF